MGAIDHELIELVNEMHAAVGGDGSPELAVSFPSGFYTLVHAYYPGMRPLYLRGTRVTVDHSYGGHVTMSLSQ